MPLQDRVAGGKPIITHHARRDRHERATGAAHPDVGVGQDHPEAVEDGSVENLPYEHMSSAFTGTAVQRLSDEGIEVFGGMGVVQERWRASNGAFRLSWT